MHAVTMSYSGVGTADQLELVGWICVHEVSVII